MDLSTVGRTRGDEQAVLEDLASSRPVGGTDRRWLIALAGIAAVVCIGFVSSAVAPPRVPPVTPGFDRAVASGEPQSMPVADARPSESPVTPAIELVQPRAEAAVTGGQVPISLRTAAHQKVHVSVIVGDAVLGRRGVTTGPDGTWSGYVEVFAPPLSLPATVRAVAVLPQGAVEAAQSIRLDGGGEVVLWNVALASGDGHSPAVEFRASAPLRFAHVSVWVTDAADARIGRTTGASFIDIWRAGSTGGRELGLGTLSGKIPVHRRDVGRLVLHLAWRDPVSGVRGSLDQPFFANDAAVR